MRNRVFIAVVVFAVSGLAHAQTLSKTYRAEQNFAIAPGGTLVVENLTGNIEIVGGDGSEIEATTVTTIRAANAAALEEGHRRTVTIVGGDAKTRIFRTNVVPNQTDWGVTVDWSLKVPRLTHVNVLSQTSRRIGVTNIAGNVRIKNFSGSVVVANATANTIVDSVNGSIAFSTPQLGPSAVLTSVNGHITASVPGDADVQWIAEAIKGDIRTNLPARGEFEGNTYRATINGQGGPTITTETLMGNIFMLANGSGISGTHSVKTAVAKAPPPPAPTIPIEGLFRFFTTLGDVTAPEIHGSADVFTGAGQVHLPKVSGAVKVLSQGGPLLFGDLGGELSASTWAGDVTVERARSGGTLTTRGGTIHVYYMKGPMRLVTMGGDIIVGRTTAPVSALTSSGDIAVVIDSGSATETVEAKTEKGNVIIHVPVNFSADVDATIVTSDPENDTFLSDLPGMSISKEQIGDGKTRIHATGKLNKGGERLLLDATNGDIRITTAPPSAAISRRKR